MKPHRRVLHLDMPYNPKLKLHHLKQLYFNNQDHNKFQMKDINDLML